MAFGFRRVPDVFDFPVGANQESASDSAGKNTAHEFLGTPDAVGLHNFAGGIADQRKIQLLLGSEFRQRGFGIGACAQDHRVELVEVFLCVTKLGRFGGSTGSVGFGEKEQHDAAASEFL